MSTTTELKQQVNKQEVKTVQDFFTEKRELIAKALPNTITPDRLIGVFTMILKSSPQLARCTQASLVGAVIQAVQLGLTPGNIGHFHLVPFNNKGILEAQFIIGFKGIVELVNRSGSATILSAECVYSKDQFEYEQGLNPKLRHVPSDSERGDFIGVYCIAKNMLADEKVFVFLPAKEIKKISDVSLSKIGEDRKKYSPWICWPDEMAKKTAVKRVAKLLPLSVEIQKRIATDETIKTQIDRSMVDVPDKADWESEPIQDAEVKEEPTNDSSWELINETQRKGLFALISSKGKDKKYLNELLMEKWAIESTTKIPTFLLEEIRGHFNKMADIPIV